MTPAAQIALLTVRIALVATLAASAPGIALGHVLARRRFAGRALVEAAVALPLVLPPVAVGLLLLQLLGRRGWLGPLWSALGVQLVFTWWAAAIAAAVMSFPLLVRASQQAFAEVPERLEQVAHTLGASRWRAFFAVTLPLARRGVLAGLLLCFARALGEFGATTLVAGSIAGKTETISLALYARVQDGDDAGAAALGLLALAIGLVATLAANALAARGTRG